MLGSRAEAGQIRSAKKLPILWHYGTLIFDTDLETFRPQGDPESHVNVKATRQTNLIAG
jgi:hypothetical protein